MSTRNPIALAGVFLCCAALLAQGGDRSGDLRAKSIDDRLAAIDWFASSDRKDAESQLRSLLGDKDLEVQERIAMSLGKMKAKTALRPLIDLSLDGDVVRVRRAAAIAVGEIDAVEGAAQLLKKAKGKTQVVAQEALALVLRGRGGVPDIEDLHKALRDGTAAVRESAAVAVLEGSPDRAAALRMLLALPYVALVCRVLDTVAEAPRAEDLQPLTEMFHGPGMTDVVGRRLFRSLAAVLALGDGDRAARALEVLNGGSGDALALTRRARLVPLLTLGERPVMASKAAIAALGPALQAGEGAVRAAAASALRRIGDDAAVEAAQQHFPRDPDARVQWVLVEFLAAKRPPKSEETARWLIDIVGSDRHAIVRERAIVRLGKSGAPGAVAALTAALKENWEIACCAAVSLGKTDDDAALQPLLQLLKHSDWKMRGAAVVGLMHYSRAEVVEPLLGMLEDAHPVVARSAHEALRNMSRVYDARQDAKSWRAWWGGAKGKHDFTDREASLEKLKKYGYAVPDSEIYAGLDVVVFQSRGDHIEQLLTDLEIGHRMTERGKVLEAGVHPEAIFVVNCTGELEAQEIEPLSWFVRTGGSLFGSCWALSETIARIDPNVMRQAQTRDQVMDDVRALPCDSTSPLLNGVFPPSVVPIYHLEGAHLITVVDPERCEVLIDSPDAAERWGCGNLAAWFFCGHGVLFDSANHFDLQGLGKAPDLKTDKQRQAYAIDHMGLSFAKWRDTRSAAYWKNAAKASENVPDLSAFRLLTNFVRSKRIGEY